MAVRLTAPWQQLTAATVAGLPAQLGVYQIADGEGRVLRIDLAGGRSLFGLRGALEAEAAARAPGHLFRLEITMQYQSRWQELLMAHVADHGELPPENLDHRPQRLGRLSPG